MQVLDKDGNFEMHIGGFGNDLGQMNEPVGIAQGMDGFVYLSDTWNSRVQQFTPDLFAINDWFVDAWDSTTINNKPYIAVDSQGRVYITDPENYRVLIFRSDGTYLARFGTFGADVGSFGLPNGISIDAEDNIYIADAGNNRVVKFAPLFSAEAVQDSEPAPVGGDESYP
jgi:sugar lactone lactonase YvrE